LELLLDVVFNHTAEGNAWGPILGLRGLGDRLYYRHSGDGAYEDFSGCGNTLDLRRAPARSLVLDALRYWVEEMHVDGFRLDLAPILGRTASAFNPAAPFFEELSADPLLCGVKWIAEPWDVGPGGYQLGRFPSPFAEWNDRFRDAARAAWRGDPETLPELVRRLEGSADLFARDRGALASVNFIVSHDGLTLRDWTRFERRHNEANGEQNHDGHPHPLSRNWGVEGATTEAPIVVLRERARRNLITMLGLARGVPMISHGDELGRSQRGNNNAYCQDNDSTWIDWRRTAADSAYLAFVCRLFGIRRQLLSWLHPEAGSPQRAWIWLSSDGERIDTSAAEGADAQVGTVLGLMAGDSDEGAVPRCLLWLNVGAAACRVRTPLRERNWQVALCSFDPAPGAPVGEVELPPWSFLLLEPDEALAPRVTPRMP
jgi:glycogen operon protein